MTQQVLDQGLLDEQWAAFVQSLVATLQDRLYELNEKDGLRQKDIAERLGYSDPTYISHLLAGQCNMKLRTAHDLARAMNARLEVSLAPYEKMVRANNRPQHQSGEQVIEPKVGSGSSVNWSGTTPKDAMATGR